MPSEKSVMRDLAAQAERGTPIVEGDKATFVWKGRKAPQLIGDFCAWQDAPVTMTRSAPGLWTHTLTFPPDAYIEYTFFQDEKRITDPLNPRTTPDGFGNRNNFFYMPDMAPTRLTKRRRNVPHGTFTRHQIEDDFLLAGSRRTVYLYQPPTLEPCPLVVVLDGQDYRRRASLANIVDNLIADNRIQPIALAMLYHSRKARTFEYACNDIHLAAIFHLLLPLAEQNLNLTNTQAQPGAYGILGASMGGLMALYTSLRAPHIFGKVLSQSGAYTIAERDMIVWDMIRYQPKMAVQIWMDAGRFEWLLEPNRRMHKLLVNQGYDVLYREYNGGHNYPTWRNDLEYGLERLFPPID